MRCQGPLTCGVALCVALAVVPGAGADEETASLIIRDSTGGMPPTSFERLTRTVNQTLAEVLGFWLADTRVQEWGKIVVEIEKPLPRSISSTFMWGQDRGRKARIVKVYGGGEHPHQLAHKLTSAVFPNPDKLIRNMMGEASETRFGNPDSFPMCGCTTDQWVLALRRVGSYIPLARIGTTHGDWGMEMHNGVPQVTDRARQHTCYAEAGSFGEHLIRAHGAEKMKLFHRLSGTTPRPWQAAFGSTLEKLETDWLQALEAGARVQEDRVTRLTELLRKNPASACTAAQDAFSRATTR